MGPTEAPDVFETSAGNFASHAWHLVDATTEAGVVLHLRQCQQCGLLVPRDVEIREPGEADGYYVVMGFFPPCGPQLVASKASR